MYKRRTAHGLHFLLTLISGGIWIPVWVMFYLINRAHNDRLQMMMFQNQHAGQPQVIVFGHPPKGKRKW